LKNIYERISIMKNVLVTALTILLSIFPLGCDDDKEKDEPCDCAPVAGEMMAGEEEPAAGEEVEAGEEMPQAGEEPEPEMDMEMPVEEPEPEAGEEMPVEEMDMEMPVEEPMPEPDMELPPECPEGQEC
jgi:hypothetical protein